MKRNIQTKLFGCDRKTVDVFLKKLHRMQDEELRELRTKVEKAKLERGRLQAELQRLDSKRRDEWTEELIDAARGSVKDTLSLLQQELSPISGIYTANNSSSTPRRKAIDFSVAAAKRSRKAQALKDKQRPAEDLERTGALEAVQQLEQDKVQNKYEGERRKPSGFGFWDDADSFMQLNEQLELPHSVYAAFEPAIEPHTDASLAESEALAVAPESRPAFGAIPDSDDGSTAAVSEFQAIDSAEAEIVAGSESDTRDQDAAAGQGKPGAVKSPEIEALKRGYIVGKLAGEDLLGRTGRLIIRKNAVITEDIVQHAELEGKLAELIVNMILPGWED